MQKMQVLMQYGKVLSESLMSLGELYGSIDDVFYSCGISKGEKGYFLGTGENDEEKFLQAIDKLKEKEWFLPNVKVWIWVTDEDTEDLKAKYCL